MICSNQPVETSRAKDLVAEALQELKENSISVELLTSPADRARWNKLIRKHHYLKEHRLVGESLQYVAKQQGNWIAVLGWSSAAYHLAPRDKYIGWTWARRQEARHLLACNSRFLLLKPKGSSPGLASHILSLNLKRLSADWQQRYGHPVILAETYVDPERFEGTCYRAANWVEIGATKGFGRARLDFYQLHQNPKAIFIYPLVRDARQILRTPVMPAHWAAFCRPADPSKYPLSREQTTSLLEALTALKDPRRYKGWKHRKVASIVAIATAAMVAGNNCLLDIGAFSLSLNQNQLAALRASRCRKTRKYLAPSESTIRRVLQRLAPAQLDQIVTAWLRSHLQKVEIETLAVDGKCLRTASKIQGQTLQLFSALDTQTRLFCRQIQIPNKRNEISCLKELLQDLDLRRTLLSADAIQTQKATAAYVVEEKKADYLLVVKANQPKLYQRLAKLAEDPDTVFFPSGNHLPSGARTA